MIVYRMLGHADELLYVGMTAQLPARLKSHAEDKPWAEVARIDLTHCATVEEAEELEARWITELQPAWNQYGGHARERVQRSLRLRRPAHEALVAKADELGISVNHAVELAVIEWMEEVEDEPAQPSKPKAVSRTRQVNPRFKP